MLQDALSGGNSVLKVLDLRREELARCVLEWRNLNYQRRGRLIEERDRVSVVFRWLSRGSRDVAVWVYGSG
jgi:hypothetical protein